MSPRSRRLATLAFQICCLALAFVGASYPCYATSDIPSLSVEGHISGCGYDDDFNSSGTGPLSLRLGPVSMLCDASPPLINKDRGRFR
jgi:hypothetical protein